MSNIDSAMHRHHVIPQHQRISRGGLVDDAVIDAPENLVELTIRDHAIAHLDRYFTHGDVEDLQAYHIIMKGGGNVLRGAKLTEEHRLNVARAAKLASNRPEVRARKSVAAKESNARPEVKAKISASMINVPKSAEHRANISAGRMGYQPSEQSRQKMSQSAKLLKWWTDGQTTIRAQDAPGPEWRRGRVPRRRDVDKVEAHTVE